MGNWPDDHRSISDDTILNALTLETDPTRFRYDRILQYRATQASVNLTNAVRAAAIAAGTTADNLKAGAAELGYFSPYRADSPARAKGCLTCTHFHGRFYSGHVLCEREPRWPHVVGVARDGCCHWMREIGADE